MELRYAKEKSGVLYSFIVVHRREALRALHKIRDVLPPVTRFLFSHGPIAFDQSEIQVTITAKGCIRKVTILV